MPAGVPRFVTINVGQLAAFKADEEVSLETLQAKRILNVSGKEAKLPLKVSTYFQCFLLISVVTTAALAVVQWPACY